MRHHPTPLLGIALLFAAGCASPFLAATGAHREPAADEVSSRERSPGRAAASDRSSGHNRRIAELLASGARNQQARNFAAARADYEQVLVLDPSNPQANFKLAIIADDEGRFADSERHYSLLLRQNPANPTLLANRGWSYFLQGRYADSERTLSAALRADPNHRAALKNLGWLYGTLGDYDKALALFRRAGSEAEAQRAVAELRQNNRASPAGGAGSNVAAANLQTPLAGRTPPIAMAGAQSGDAVRGLNAPAPWATPNRVTDGAPATQWRAAEILGGAQDSTRRPVGESADRYSAVDEYAESSPSQANRPGQADIGSPSDTPFSGFVDRRVNGAGQGASITDTSLARSSYPVITPRASGAVAQAGGAPVPARPPVERGMGDDRRRAAAPAGPPEWPGSAVVRSSNGDMQFAEDAGAHPAPTGTAAATAQAGPSSWQDVQNIAAQVGLGAGAAGPMSLFCDWPVTSRADASRAAAAPAAAAPPPPARFDANGAFLPPDLQPAPIATRDLNPGQPSPSPSWPRRGTLPPPMPTDVVPSEPTAATAPAGGPSIR